MTARVLENLTVLPTHAHSFRMLLTRLARTIDALVSARAARQVPEWQMRHIRREATRYQNLFALVKKRQVRR